MEDMLPNHLVLLDNILDANSQPRELPLHFLKSVTDDFSEERVIGRGGFGVVYKGELKNRTIAVKKLAFSNNAEKDFDREIQNLMRVRHQNIVRFLGYVNDTKSRLVNLANPGEPERHSFVYTQQRILCFEYISNGSLTDHIHDELRGPEWHTRYKIIKGICQALDYLHNKKNLVHRDLKPDNILIDNLMAPKIADLGISKLLNSGVSKSMTTTARATWEYAAPEFADRVVSVKYDIYSLGIIIIELVTGFRRAPSLNTVLTRWRHRWNKSNEALRYQQVRKCIEIGLSCQNQRPKKRPFISKIIKDLEDVDGGNCAVQQEIPCWNEQLLWVEPPELFFPFQINKRISSSLELHNETDAYMAFFIKTYSDVQYEMYPIKGIIQPRSHLSVDIILIAQEEEPEKMWNADEFIIKSKKVNVGLTAEDITKDIFRKKSGDIMDKVRIGVVFYAKKRAPCCIPENPKQQLSLEPLQIFILGSKEKGETSYVAESDTQSMDAYFFTVRIGQGHELKQLRDLNLQGSLKISGLGNVTSGKEALEANLAAKERLTELKLEWDPSSTTCSPEVEAEVLEGFCPPVGLKKLEISVYRGSRYPDWMVGKHNGGPKDLQELDLHAYGKLPAPQLVEAFPHLCVLTLSGDFWDALPSNMEHLTSLKKLVIGFNNKIQSLPTLPRSLEEFHLSYCDDKFMKSCITVGHPNWQKIEHIPEKKIR